MKKREKSAVLQFITNIYTVVVTSLMPFVVRTVLIRYIGIEYVGINSLFASILRVLNMADFGLTTALAFYLYKPAEADDRQSINSIMRYFRGIFHKVGMIILLAGLLIMPFLRVLVKGKEYPIGLNIYIIYLTYILQTSIYYFANVYISTLLWAYLKSHINSLISGTALLVMYAVQIVIVATTHNYYFFSWALLVNCIVFILLYLFAKTKYFPWLDYKGEVSVEFKKIFRIRMISMLLSKLRNVSRNSFDCIIVSMLFGLTILAEYQNYYLIMTIPYMIAVIIRQAVQPSLGNGIASETMESNYGIVKQYLFINNFVSTICATCLLSLTQPFIKIWLGEAYMMGDDIVICIVIYYFVLSLSEGSVLLREATGIWKEGRWVCAVEAIANLILNVLFAKWFGLCGIIIATIVTLLIINIPLESYYVCKGYFIMKHKDYLYRLSVYTIESAFITIISFTICNKIEIVDYMMALVRVLVTLLLPTGLYLGLHRRDEEMRTTIVLFLKTIKSIGIKSDSVDNNSFM